MKDIETLKIASGFLVFLALYHVSDIFTAYWNVSTVRGALGD